MILPPRLWGYLLLWYYYAILLSMTRKTLSKKVRQEVYAKYNGHCAYCGKPIEYKDMQIDHLVSVYAHGGTDDIDNLMPSCRACNYYKSTYPLEDFRKLLSTVVERLDRDFTYRIAKTYGIITENDNPIVFYFERVENVKDVQV